MLPPFLQNFSLEGRTVIITGGTGGIGLGVSQAFAESGADVVSLQLPTEPTDVKDVVEKAGRKCSIVHINLLETDSIPKIVEQACLEHNPDILVNCAGIHQSGPSHEFPLDATERILRLNILASIAVAQAVVRHWLSQQQPDFNRKIINFASISSFQGGSDNVAYASSKGGVLNMTRAMSNDWAPMGINVNSVAPGYTKSRMTERIYDDEDFNKWLFPNIPCRRWADSKDMAAACIFLASQASNYISGHSLVVDGGILGGPPPAGRETVYRKS